MKRPLSLQPRSAKSILWIGAWLGTMAILPACEPPPETVAGAAASSGKGPSGGAGGTDVVEANQLTPSARRRLRRLSNREYNNVVHDLLGNTTSPANTFLTD